MRADNPSQSLRKAVKAGSLPKVLAALALGGNPHAPGSSGRTALQIAQSRGHKHLLPSLSQAAPVAATALRIPDKEGPIAPAAAQPSRIERAQRSQESFELAPATPAPATSIWEEMALRSDGFGPLPVRLSPGRTRVMR